MITYDTTRTNKILVEQRQTSCELDTLDVMQSLNLTISVRYLKNGFYFPNDTNYRDIYNITLTSHIGLYRFSFGTSVCDTEKQLLPSAYDILAALTKHEVGTIEDFQANYGTTTGYKACLNEYKNLCALFAGNEIPAELQEIN